MISDYLLGKRDDSGTYENHIFFLDSLDSSPVDLPEKFLWYALRSIDSLLMVNNREKIFAFAKLPGILLISSISPSSTGSWSTSKIEESGQIRLPQEVNDAEIASILVRRSLAAMRFTLSTDEQEKVAKSIKNSTERVLNSKGLEVILAEGRKKRAKTISELHPVVRQFVSIIDSAENDGKVAPKNWKAAELAGHLVANTLVALPENKVKQLQNDICEAIKKSRPERVWAMSVSDLGEIVVILHIYPGSSLEQRKEKIENTLAGIEEKEMFLNAKAVLSVAFNPEEKLASFQFNIQTILLVPTSK